MNTAKRIILWLTFILACFIPASAVSAVAAKDCFWGIFSNGYDAAQTEVTCTCDGAKTYRSAHDTALIGSAFNEEEPSDARRALFCQNVEFMAADSGMTNLYRAVNPEELTQLNASGGAFANPAGIEVKYFSTTAEGAASYAKQTFGTGLYQGPYSIVQTAIPSSSITPIMQATVDRGISTVVVPTEMLPTLSPANPLGYTPLPTVP